MERRKKSLWSKLVEGLTSGLNLNPKNESFPIATSLVKGVVAFVFLVIGYQTALFVHKASVMRILSNRDMPDTVFVYMAANGVDTLRTEYRKGNHSAEASLTALFYESSSRNSSQNSPKNVLENNKVLSVDESKVCNNTSKNTSETISQRTSNNSSKTASKTSLKNSTNSSLKGSVKSSSKGSTKEYSKRRNSKRKVENFRFNPNTVEVGDLVRLGFSIKQAKSIDNYRKKGGRFARKTDFARSFVVADSVYKRLENYIDIPLLDINAADSLQLIALPGIGKYFASKILQYRERLQGFSYKEQLMDIYHFDKDKFERLQDLIYVGDDSYPPYPLWTLPEEKLREHPYILSYAAHGIVVFRENNPKEKWTVGNLSKAGILRKDLSNKLLRCRLEVF